MSLRDFFRRNDPDTNVINRAEIISRYKHLRAVGRKLNHKMVERLSKDVLHEGGKKLGILRKNVLVFNSEDESAVLMDYCIYDVRRNGRNAVKQYLVIPHRPQSPMRWFAFGPCNTRSIRCSLWNRSYQELE